MEIRVTIFYLLVAVTFADTIQENPQCVGRIKKFSSNKSPSHFYECDGDGHPALQECPPGQLYNLKKESCLSKDDKPRNEPIDVKSMGRFVGLGKPYNAKKAEFYSTTLMWDVSTIDDNKSRYSRKEVTTDFTADKTKYDKASHFDIGASLKMEFMSGMVEVEGAMTYLDDEVESEEEVNVEMLFHTTKYTETMPKYIPVDHTNECENSDYTHVVTSVTYGLDCNFVFKYKLAKHESESSITGELKIAINNIPSFSISGEGSVNLTESERNLMEKTSLKMFGDLSFDTEHPMPTDFDSSVDFYKTLPEIANKQASILEVHLTPIEDVCTEADNFLNDLSDSMMAEVIDMLDELNQLEIKANGLVLSPVTQKFPALRKNMNKFISELQSFSLNIKKQLSDIIPKIRGGEEEGVQELIGLLKEYINSPFEFETSDQFLIDRNREISSVSFLLDSFPDDAANIAVCDYEQANDIESMFKHEYVTMLNFKILTPESLTDNFLNGQPQDESDFWYNDIQINGKVGSILRNFSKFALENADDETDKPSDYGFLIQLEKIEEGVENPTEMTVNYEAFKEPSAPLEPNIYGISHNAFKLSVSKGNNFTNGLIIRVTNVYEEDMNEKTIEWEEAEGQDQDIEIKVENDNEMEIKPVTVYSVIIQYRTKAGLGPKSKPSKLFITAPSTPPKNIAISEVTTNSLKVSWEKPEHIGQGINETSLMYSVKLTGEYGYSQHFNNQTIHSVVFDNLVEATKYTIEARTYLETENEYFDPNGTFTGLQFVSMSQSAIISQNCNPFSPEMIPSRPGEVTTNSAVARWEPPARLPNYEDLHYIFEYAEEIAEGQLGDWKSFNTTNQSYIVTNLKNATRYIFRVQVVTDIGQSEFSSNFLVKTLDEKSDLDNVVDKVIGDLNDIFDQMKTRSSFCASIHSTKSTGQLTFEKLFLEDNNVPGATLDPSSGTFTAGSDGSHQVMVSAEVVSSPGQEHSIWIAKNGEKKDENKIYSKYDYTMAGTGLDNASRNILLDLEKGDTVTVIHETEVKRPDGTTNENGELLNVIFCVSSVKLKLN